MKCFEVANSLADTVLLTPSASHPRFELGPQDFLHALYQKLSPFLEQDEVLNSILRIKTAEVLVMAPARLLTRQLGNGGFVWHGSTTGESQVHKQQFEANALFDDLFTQLELPSDQPHPQQEYSLE